MNYNQIIKKMHQEGAKQGYAVYGGACLALYEDGWREKRLATLLEQIRHDWNVCARDTHKSAIKMLYEDTGIELRPEGSSSRGIDELDWLNGKSADRTFTQPELFYMRSQQIKWMRPQVMAILFLVLHKQYGWGAERLVRLMEQIDAYSLSSTKMIQEVKKVTGIDLPKYTG